MPNLTPVSSFDAVPELETTTLALGGPGGPMNLPLQALVNRTQWLHDNAAAGSSSPYAAAAGTANAITATYTPAITATVDGLKLRFVAATTNTGAATFAPDALTAAPILGQAGLALQGGEIAANGEVEVTWNATLSAWVMTGCSGGAVQVADATASHHAASKGQLDAVSTVANAAAPSADLASSAAGKGASLVYDAAKSSDLASTATGKGAALIGYKLNGVAGAVARTLYDKWADRIDVKDFGAKGDGTTDDTAAVQAALTYIASRGGALYFPTGVYLLTGQVSCTYAAGKQVSCRLFGESQASTTLKWTSATAGFLINMVSQTQSVHFADMSLTTTQAGQGTAIKVTQTDPLGLFAMSSFENITIRGYSNNLGVDYWARGVHMYDASGTSFVGVTIFGGGGSGTSGEGLKFEGSGTDAAHYSIYHNIDKSTFNSLAYGIIYDTYAQGITVSQCNFQNGYIGVWLPTGSVGHAQLNLNDNQFAVNNIAILMQSNIGTFTLRGNDIFTKNGANGISISDGAYGTIVGNTLVNNGAKTNTGIQIGGGQKFVINDNTIAGMNVGINLGASASYITVGSSNVFNINNNDISSASPNSTVLNANLATSGTATLSGGLIHKWGSASVTLDASGNGTVTYPTAFPNGYYAGTVCCGDPAFSGSAAFSIQHASCTASTLAFSVRPNPGAVGVRVNYQVNGH